MSDSECIRDTKITSVVKTKDPRRVEAGKRLGMISKQAKERKAREAHEAKKNVENEWFPGFQESSVVTGVGVVGLLGLVLYFTMVKKNKKEETGKTVSETASVKKQEDEKAVSGTKGDGEATSMVRPKRVYKELDTLD